MPPTEIEDISEDTPLIGPEQDRLGYTTFAKNLADSICKMTVTDVFAIAIYGSWNSGKSTLLNFVVHYLRQRPDEEQPIIVPFNPWLFSGHQDITRRFFDQLQNVLTKITYVPKGIRERIADFAKVIAEIPLPYAQASRAVVQVFDDKAKEASELKEDVEDTLLQESRRIVITIDDIDRLAADDIKQLFRLLKAIPNFKNVVYLLSFNKDVVIKSLTDDQEIGQAQLEKMIQVAFELPCPNKTSLRRLLFERLNTILSDVPSNLFDAVYWNQVYFQGIDHFINNLRDIVILNNTLTVTYSVVKGEVNPIDFIAIETLRVFSPIAYDLIQKNPNAFVEEANFSLEELKSFHNSWIVELESKDKEPVKNLLINLFPKLRLIWGNCDNKQSNLEWQEQRRICCPEIFPVYFRLNLSESNLSENQIMAILTSAYDAKVFRKKLIELTHQKRLDGTTQLRAFLEQLENYPEEISNHHVSAIIQALFDVGEQLLCPEDEPKNIFDSSNETRILRLISHLLYRLNETARFEVLKTSTKESQALSIITKEVEILVEQQASTPEEEWLINAENLEELKKILAERTS